ncbi:MAG: leucyl/phenylalanyl-tRNA--protein transferase [Gammaproteobacteria bacterium]
MDSPELNRALYWVGARCLAADFPPTSHALADPDGLLAIGGDLGPSRLLDAYAHGIFPWYSDGQPVLWWAPAIRAVLEPADVEISRSLAKRLRNGGFEVSFDTDFAAVITACAAPRADATGTWITAAMQAAYTTLHHGGYAHSVECRRDGELVGGLYGVALGRVFCGESMFSCVRDASKVAFVQLCRWLAGWGYGLVDCQLPTAHLASLGAIEMPRAAFEARLHELAVAEPAVTAWRQ